MALWILLREVEIVGMLVSFVVGLFLLRLIGFKLFLMLFIAIC